MAEKPVSKMETKKKKKASPQVLGQVDQWKGGEKSARHSLSLRVSSLACYQGPPFRAPGAPTMEP